MVGFDYQRVFESSLADTLYDLCVLQSVESTDPLGLRLRFSLPSDLSAPMPRSYVTVLAWDGCGVFDRESIRRSDSPESVRQWLSNRRSFTFPSQNHPDLQCRASMSDRAAKAVEAWRFKPDGWMLRRRESKRSPGVTAKFNAYLHALGDLRLSVKDRSFNDIKTQYLAEMTAEVERQQRHRDRRKEIAALPQLFLSG